MEKKDKSHSYFSVSLPKVVASTCFLPLAGMIFSEAWSVVVNFEMSTSTICPNRRNGEKVWNFLPSISAATGMSPQQYVWRIFIALHSTPRISFAFGYYNMHWAIFKGNARFKIYQYLTKAALFLHLTEIMSLVGLSFISSKENYDAHKFCFESFMLSSITHMVIMYVIFKYGQPLVSHTIDPKTQRSLAFKQLCILINITSFMAACYFFYRHSAYCEDGVYSLFALFEIIVVTSNIAFHGTAIIDFHTSRLVIQDTKG